MKLLFEEITEKVLRYTMNDSSWFLQNKEDIPLRARAHISVSRQDRETVLLKGDLDGKHEGVCDRCGEEFTENIQSKFVYHITTREEVIAGSDIECSEEDVMTLYLETPEIDVDEILREQSYLALPVKTLCRQDCNGICAGCGVNLNSERCSCLFEKSNSPFAVLKRLKDN